MKNEQIQPCPLCQNAARFVPVDHNNGKYFSCPHCTEFQISIGAETRVLNSIPQWRTQLSELAHHGNDEKILVVTLSPAGQRQEGVANPALQTEFVARTELLQ